MFSKLLIANRGEIACRIIRTAQDLGIATVAVYSDADREALHVLMADESVHIGDNAPAASYLNIGVIIDAAKRCGVDAIHPGYGFLSENARFASACADNDIAFVGPPIAAIEAMGSKSAAKAIMHKAGVPLLPGYHGNDQDDATLQSAARDIGYPVLLKAAAGGGGKGMRVVADDDAFGDELAAARREASGAFGDETMLVEKYLAAPRHIELQVFADQHGNVVHLFDRDCSIQRRHQKIIEEAPAPGLSDTLRADMANAAIEAARAIDYVGAGTVEFLLDHDGAFYFMEMNTRLQVEHPVTEMITGVDLVAWQLSVANGATLPRTQEEIRQHGHAIEARVYAEDADNDFLPTSGRLDAVRLPAEDATTRIDSGVRGGDTVSVFYDPMIAKLIVHGDDRESARRRMLHALDDYLILGVTNNLAFLRRAIATAQFAQGGVTTGFIQDAAESLASAPAQRAACIAAAVLVWHQTRSAAGTGNQRWHEGRGWRANLPNTVPIALTIDGENAEVMLAFDHSAASPVGAHNDDKQSDISATVGETRLRLIIDGHSRDVAYVMRGGRGVLSIDGARHQFARATADTGEAKARHSDGNVRAPMTGRVVRVDCAEGDVVTAGQTLLVLEAMKMEHTLKAPLAGTIAAARVSVNQLVNGGDVLVTIDNDADDAKTDKE